MYTKKQEFTDQLRKRRATAWNNKYQVREEHIWKEST